MRWRLGLVDELLVPVEMSSCTARILDLAAGLPPA